MTASISARSAVGQLPRRRAAFAVDLLGLGRARDHARDRRPREQPRERELEQRVAVVASPTRRAPRPGRSSCRRTPARCRSAGMPASRVPAGGASLRRYLPVSIAAREREVRDEREAVLLRTRRARRSFRAAAQQAVLVLHAHEPRDARARALMRVGLVDHLGREVAAPDLAHLARAHQLVERAERLLDRRRAGRGSAAGRGRCDRCRAAAGCPRHARADVRRARAALARPRRSARRTSSRSSPRRGGVPSARPRYSSLSVPP